MESHRDIQYRHSQQRAVDEPTRSVSPSAAAAYSVGPQFASPHGSFSLSPNVTTSPAPTAPFPVQHLDEWRAVGQRRASQSALMPSGGYFTQKLMKRNLIDLAEEPFHDEQQRIFVSDMPVQTAPPGFDLTREAATAQGIHPHDRRMSVQRDGFGTTLDDGGADVPIFQFFGGRARSFSLSLGSSEGVAMHQPWQHAQAHGSNRLHSTSQLQYAEAGQPRARSRSSSFVIESLDEIAAVQQLMANGNGSLHNMRDLWAHPSDQHQYMPSQNHRRASTVPSQTSFWGDHRSASVSPPPVQSDMRRDSINSSEIATRYFAGEGNELLQRRASAVTDTLSDAMQNLEIKSTSGKKTLPSNFGEQYGKFFEPSDASTDGRSQAPAEKSKKPLEAREKGLKHGPIFVIEFKGGRNDFFYLPKDASFSVTKGDLVIVEADRGVDLGKVVIANITHPSQVQLHQVGPEAYELLQKEVQPKFIQRIAQETEVKMLLDKARDETKALGICQAKVRQKKLPMEVVDAEYQWDRRKLTFFFVAEQRIDFRELVRDLFKIYKTRIWMCAVDRSGQSQ